VPLAPAALRRWAFLFMAKVYFLVDGFNIYHALDCNPAYHKFKWLSFARLARCYVLGADSIEGVEFFTTLATWDPAKVARHKLLIKANEDEGVVVTYGEFKKKTRRCSSCKQVISTVEEKQTDVNIALRLFQLAVEDRYDKAIIISGDTDLLPAVKAVQRTFPAKQIGVLLPIGRASENFKKQADFHHKMKPSHLIASVYPDPLVLKDGVTALNCPPTWKKLPLMWRCSSNRTRKADGVRDRPVVMIQP
jgi:uncharacterized LabA/DUF88 family protein